MPLEFDCKTLLYFAVLYCRAIAEEKLWVCGSRLWEGVVYISHIIAFHIHNTKPSQARERAGGSITSKTGWHAPLNTAQSVVVYSLAFPFPSAFYTQSPSCHDTQAFHKYSWYLWGYIPSRLENRKPWPYESLACSRANRRSIHNVPRRVGSVRHTHHFQAQGLLTAL